MGMLQAYRLVLMLERDPYAFYVDYGWGRVWSVIEAGL